ncbi:MAG: poly-gamma-glutamate system protein [Candidatus Ornithospirochaeta sp.]
MKHRPLKIRKRYLFSALAILALGLFLTLFLAEKEANDYEEAQRNAAERMERAEAYIKKNILEKGIEIESTDLNKTGLIGPEFTELTSTPGEESAKRSTLNPEFAAAMVRYFHDAGLEEGDAVAIGSSGSFPGFLIAVLTAATEMKLEARVIASVGASMHGATRVEYNIFDILNDLKESGEAEYSLLGVSCGGQNDRGGSVMEGFIYEGTAELSLEICRKEAERTGAVLIYKNTLAESIQERLSLFGDDVKMFVNIGGASTNNGTSSYTLDFPPGMVMSVDKIPQGGERGLIFEYAAREIPVVNLLSVKKLCQENSIPFDPVPLPSSSSSAVYSSVTYNPVIIAATLLLALLVLALGTLDKKRKSKGM